MKRYHALTAPLMLSVCLGFFAACGQVKASDSDKAHELHESHEAHEADDKHDNHEGHDEHDEHDKHAHNQAEQGALSAHVHGEGQFVIVKTKAGFMANFIAPLASVGLKPSLEDISKLPKAIQEGWLTADSAAKCTAQKDLTFVSIIRAGDHGDLDLDMTFTCKNMDELGKVTLNLFDQTPALEKVEGLLIVNGDQKVQILTQENPTLVLK